MFLKLLIRVFTDIYLSCPEEIFVICPVMKSKSNPLATPVLFQMWSLKTLEF